MTQNNQVRSDRSGLKQKIFKGSFWTVAGFGSQKVLQLLSNLILTRLLFPEAFGLMAIVNVFISGVYMLSDVGIKPAIIQMNKAGDHNFLNTAWTIQILRGFLLYIALCLVAFPTAALYDDPRLIPLLCFTGLTTIVSGFKSIGVALADRDLLVKRSIALRLSGQAITTVSMVILAVPMKSVWALAIGTVLGAVVEIIMGFIILPKHKHSLRFDKQSALELFHFGKWIFWATLFTFLGGQGIRAIEGALVDMKTLGLIAIAATLAMALVELIQQFQAKIVFPTLSIFHREEPARFAGVLAKMRVRITMIALPLFAVTSICSTIIVDLLYDERYSFAGPLLSILAINGALSTLPMLYQNALMAKGNTRMHFILITLTTVFRILGMLIGFYVGGVFGMLIGTGIGSLAVYVFIAFVVKRYGWLALKFDLASIVVILAAAVVSYQVNLSSWSLAVPATN